MKKTCLLLLMVLLTACQNAEPLSYQTLLPEKDKTLSVFAVDQDEYGTFDQIKELGMENYVRKYTMTTSLSTAKRYHNLNIKEMPSYVVFNSNTPIFQTTDNQSLLHFIMLEELKQAYPNLRGQIGVIPNEYYAKIKLPIYLPFDINAVNMESRIYGSDRFYLTYYMSNGLVLEAKITLEQTANSLQGEQELIKLRNGTEVTYVDSGKCKSIYWYDQTLDTQYSLELYNGYEDEQVTYTKEHIIEIANGFK